MIYLCPGHGHLGQNYEWRRAVCSKPPSLLPKGTQDMEALQPMSARKPHILLHQDCLSLERWSLNTHRFCKATRTTGAGEKKTVWESKLHGLYEQRIFHTISFLRKLNEAFLESMVPKKTEMSFVRNASKFPGRPVYFDRTLKNSLSRRVILCRKNAPNHTCSVQQMLLYWK